MWQDNTHTWRLGENDRYERVAEEMPPVDIQQELLSMMVEDLGPTRFASFWGSHAPVMEAFAAAAGMPFAEWYRNQLRREMKQAGFAPPGERTSWPSVIGILALTLGGSLWHAKRRQMR